MKGTVRLIKGIVSTDDIIPSRYKHMYTDANELSKHVFEAYNPEFTKRVEQGDILVSKSTFGIGSSREQVASALKATGISAILAPSFGRIFYRNAWNLALPVLEMDTNTISDEDNIEIKLKEGIVLCGENVRLEFSKPSTFHLEILSRGGLLPTLSHSINSTREK